MKMEDNEKMAEKTCFLNCSSTHSGEDDGSKVENLSLLTSNLSSLGEDDRSMRRPQAAPFHTSREQQQVKASRTFDLATAASTHETNPTSYSGFGTTFPTQAKSMLSFGATSPNVGAAPPPYQAKFMPSFTAVGPSFAAAGPRFAANYLPYQVGAANFPGKANIQRLQDDLEVGAANFPGKANIQRLQDGIEVCNYSNLLKVPHQLRQVNENAYEPQLISIGPYHRSKPHLKEMEVYKERCLNWICHKKGKGFDKYCKDAVDVDRARKCYSPSLDLESQEPPFVDMMLRDGCFIVELLCGKAQEIDPFFKLNWVLNALIQDILLLENQLPFFVLADLYSMIQDNPTDANDFASLAFSVLCDFVPGPMNWIECSPIIKDTDKIKHLLSLVHDNWLPSPSGIKRHQDYNTKKTEEAREEGGQEKWKLTLCAVEKAKENRFQGNKESGVTEGENCCFFKWKFICCARNKMKNRRKGLVEWQSIRCATELEEAGIKFMKINWSSSTEDGNAKSLFDISFTNATMKIPTFVVDDYTERLLRNFIAYELYVEGSTYVIDYVTLMDNLINTVEDVQLLRFNGIIENMLGDDEAVAQMINKLRDHGTLCGDNFYYEEIFVDVKEHCARPWNTWRAKLMRDYFGTPWAPISFVAASIIFLISIAQFILSIVNKKE